MEQQNVEPERADAGQRLDDLEGDHVEIIGGREQREIVIVEHDPAWSRRFEVERDRIAAALASTTRIEHVGSTSIPGLAAKPIIDIQVAVPDVDGEASYVAPLEAVGYVLRARERNHRLLRTPERDVHVHVCSIGSDWERRHLLFRDWLRTDRDDRAAYEAVKRDLAGQSWPTMQHYADAKSEIIAAITTRAEAWAARSGWSVTS